MKDNISIIFASIIGVLLIVILPLFSILDRQDSMSYNVVLTQTTNFVDNIRHNGFIDQESYYNYISALASTSNTYKVEMEIYKKRLIKDVDAAGDVYVEDLELFNTTDVLEVIGSENSITDAETSNEKNNVYLLKEGDEVYFKVYNTNITAGSIIYSAFAGGSTTKVIDISYGGVVNNVNWELFNEINASVIDIPEVLMEVPVNANNKINIMKVTEDSDLEEIDCNEFYDLCEDGITASDRAKYTYLYDLTYTENKQMTIAVELKNVDYIVIGENADGSLKLAALETLTEQQFNAAKSYIIQNFIQLNEMTAKIDLKYRGKEEYYMFDIILKDVEISSYGLMSVFASVSVLQGLGQDEEGTVSMAAESVQLELVDETAVHTVTISDSINWKKLLSTGNVTDSLMTGGEVYVNQEIAFVISYTGVDNSANIKRAVQDNLMVEDASYSGLQILTAEELKNSYNVNLNTRTVGHVLVKFKYTSENPNKENYIKINTGWVATDIDNEEDYINEDYVEVPLLAYGAESNKYEVWIDNGKPVAPTILVDGIKGANNWYIRDSVTLTVQKSTTDTIIKNNRTQIGGVGVEKNTLTLTGATQRAESENTECVIENEGTTYAVAKAYDYLGNVISTSTVEIKLDKTPPASPKITISGTKGVGNWYVSNVTLTIDTGADGGSGLQRTTYKVTGAETVTERTVAQTGIVTLTESGLNRVTIITYDNSGNSAETVIDVYIDKTTPSGVTFDVVSGSKNTNGWYNTDVELNITVNDNTSPSGLGKVEYELIGTNGGNSISKTEITGGTKELAIQKSGEYTLKTYTYNVAGNVNIQEYSFKIDKEVPSLPAIIEYSNVPINNGWYTSNVNVVFSSNGDVGPSGVQSISYTSTTGGATSGRTEITSPWSFDVTSDGIYMYDFYVLDYASNETRIQTEIKLDATVPTSAEFVINGTKGLNDWYTSNVGISYTGGADATSGIKAITLSHTELTSDTAGTLVSLTTEDNAGNKVERQTTIKVDKTLPTTPTITLPSVTGTGIAGVNLYNKNVDIAIAGGTDTNLDRTTYKVVDSNTNQEVIAETAGTALSLVNNGKYELTTYTYDKAGNRSVVSRVIWINKDKPQAPVISSIDGQSITSQTNQTVISTNNTLNIEFSNIEIGSKLKVVLVEATTYGKKEVEVQGTTTNQLVTINLDTKGTYSITATQTNMYGTQSDVNVGNYNYQYE